MGGLAERKMRMPLLELRNEAFQSCIRKGGAGNARAARVEMPFPRAVARRRGEAAGAFQAWIGYRAVYFQRGLKSENGSHAGGTVFRVCRGRGESGMFSG